MSVRLRWMLVLAWAGLIIGASSIPGPEMPEQPPLPHLDKLVHLVVYGVLGALLARALRGHAGRGAAFAVAVALVALFGAGDELWQSFVPGRDATVLDWLADLAGAALGAHVVTRRV